MTEKLLAKAQLIELKSDFSEYPEDDGKKVTIQFNPESLKLNYANEIIQEDSADQGGGSSQFVGAGSTTMALDLWFDVTADTTNRADDVRILTKDIIYFMTPKDIDGEETKKIPPAVRFLWGSFLFEGIIDSLTENLEFFSPAGKPLRASMSLSFKQQKIILPTVERDGTAKDAVGTKKLTPAKTDDSLQQMATNSDSNQNWQDIAAANDIEDPLRMPPGKLVDMNPAKSIDGGLPTTKFGGGLGSNANALGGLNALNGLPGGTLKLAGSPSSSIPQIKINPPLPKLSID